MTYFVLIPFLIDVLHINVLVIINFKISFKIQNALSSMKYNVLYNRLQLLKHQMYDNMSEMI